MSPMSVMTLGMERMGRISTARRMLFEEDEDDLAMVREATWVHPPGAAQRSMMTLAVSRKWNLRLICVNLNAARDL